MINSILKVGVINQLGVIRVDYLATGSSSFVYQNCDLYRRNIKPNLHRRYIALKASSLQIFIQCNINQNK